MNTFRLPDETHVSRVHLRTAQLAKIADFYVRVIGLNLSDRGTSQISVAPAINARPLIVFTEDREAVPRPPRTTGLYHFAIRFPSRRDLADALQRLIAAEYPIEGASDHGVSEAIYLSDPEGNGIELYVDRPRADWPVIGGQLQMVTEASDFDDLLRTASDGPIPKTVPAGTDLGHIHLHVRDLPEAEKFFKDFLGFTVMQRMAASATFLAAGGYHHHVGINTWAGKASAPENAVGLVAYRLEVPDTATAEALKQRAKQFEFEAREANGVLLVRDPNDCWLEVESAAKKAAA